ncbi:MAG: diguanylate cyclase [Magnetospirillum sp. WYHS-4]
MVDNTELSRIDVVHSTDARPRWQRRQPGGQQHSNHGAYRAPARDATEFLGLSPRELTPAVQKAIAGLMAELEHERRDADLAQERVAYLEELITHHSYLPVLNRRALLREIGKAAERARRTGIASVFGLIHLRNTEAVRRRFGRRTADAMQVFAADLMNDSVRETDAIGAISDGDFGIVLALAYEQGAAEKIREIVATLNRQRVTWEGTPIPFEAEGAVRPISAGETPESVVADADRDLVEMEDRLLEAKLASPWETPVKR